MTEFIDAPWKCYTTKSGYEITDLVNFPICEIPLWNNKECSKQTARLITVAPNMYELLSECAQFAPKEIQDKIQHLMSEVAWDD